MAIVSRSILFLVAQQLFLPLSTLVVATASTTHFVLPGTIYQRPSLPSRHNHPIQPASWQSPFLACIRGGALLDDEDDYDSDEEYDDDDELFELDEGTIDGGEDEFAEENMIDRAWVAWQKTPPVTKAYLSASIVATMYGYVLNKNEFPSLLKLDWTPTLKRMQIWRPFTAFLNFGPFGLGYALTSQFVWTYMSTLERVNHDKPYDFWIMIAFGCLSMVFSYKFMGLSPTFLGHNLSTYLVYIWSRFHEGLDVNVFELFNIRAELLPWFFIAQTFLLEGQPPILDLLGIAFGHVYHHCKTMGMLRAPQFVVEWYLSDNPYSTAIRNKYKKISSDFQVAQ